MGRAKMVKSVGKPRRSKWLSNVRSVRVPDKVYYRLHRYFGSLGNALVYLYEGIEELKAREGVPSDIDEVTDITLKRGELEDIFLALKWYAKQEHHPKYRGRLERIALKVLNGAYLGEGREDPETAEFEI